MLKPAARALNSGPGVAANDRSALWAVEEAVLVDALVFPISAPMFGGGGARTGLMEIIFGEIIDRLHARLRKHPVIMWAAIGGVCCLGWGLAVLPYLY